MMNPLRPQIRGKPGRDPEVGWGFYFALGAILAAVALAVALFAGGCASPGASSGVSAGREAKTITQSGAVNLAVPGLTTGGSHAAAVVLGMLTAVFLCLWLLAKLRERELDRGMDAMSKGVEAGRDKGDRHTWQEIQWIAQDARAADVVHRYAQRRKPRTNRE